MAKRDYYEVLGVDRNVDKNGIKKAFRRLAKQYHPDANKEEGAAEKFREINEANEVLSDPQKRSAYDRYGHAAFENGGGGPGGFGNAGFDVADIFEEFLNGFAGASGRRSRNAPRKGSDLRYDLRVDFMDAVFGKDIDIEVTKPALCTDCGGSGAQPGTTPVTCSDCSGTGEVRRVQQSILGQFVNVTTCSTCRGQGKRILEHCKTCGGQGQIQKTSNLTIRVPPGANSETPVVIQGEGSPGINGGPAGNLYVVLQVKPHEHFERRGDDVYISMNINVAQAALGDEITIPVVDGEETLTIPAGTQPGTRFTLRARGVPRSRRSGRGDHHTIIQVSIPKKLSGDQERLFMELGEQLGSASVAKRDRGFFEGLRDTLEDWFGL
ncbi:MAG: molecular chaperone DnaJ [Chloroflexota bacterium]